MALPTSGIITMEQVKAEFRTTNDPISLNDFDIREATEIPSGSISMQNLYGKGKKEVVLLFFGLRRGGNSGGKFNLSEYFFRNSNDIRLVAARVITASKYEQFGNIIYTDGSTKNARFNTSVTRMPKELSLRDNVVLHVPESANYWYGEFYGVVYNRHNTGKSIELSKYSYHNLAKQ